MALEPDDLGESAFPSCCWICTAGLPHPRSRSRRPHSSHPEWQHLDDPHPREEILGLWAVSPDRDVRSPVLNRYIREDLGDLRTGEQLIGIAGLDSCTPRRRSCWR